MLRLGGSQALRTHRDVTRTLNPKRTRRPPTHLHTKGKQPIRSAPYPAPSVPHINTSRPSTSSPSTFISGQRDRIPPSSSAPNRPSSPDWSTFSDTETTSSSSSSSFEDSNMAEQSALAPSTDGADDEVMATYLREMGPFRQVASLETIDSFPFLPYSPPPSLMFRIYEDPIPPMPSPVGGAQALEFYEDRDPQPFPYSGRPYHGEEYDEGNAWAGEGDEMGGGGDEKVEGEEAIILNEAIWDPNTMLVAEIQAGMALQNDVAPRAAAERLESPPA